MYYQLLSATRNCIAFICCFIIVVSALAQPAIHSFTPSVGPIGTKVTITGTNFGATPASNSVYFGAVPATVLAANPTTLVVTVPAGATNQPITISTNRFVAAAKEPFAVTAPAPYSGITAASFATKVSFASGGYPNFVLSGDLDQDGKADLITLNNNASTMTIFQNTGGIGLLRFSSGNDYPVGLNPFGAALGDLNGDGKLDIVVGDYGNSQLLVLKNTSSPGNISFTGNTAVITGQNPISIGIADFDKDGKLDVATVNNNGHTISVFKNITTDDHINFATKIDLPVGNWPQRLTIADLNNDGKPDMAVANYNDNTVSVLKNTSTATTLSFATKMDLPTGEAPFHVSSGDLDKDGKPEMVVSNSSSGNISIYKNTSVGETISFAAKVDVTTGTSPLYSVISDLDGDGNADITVVNFGSNTVSVLRNVSQNNTITLEPKTDYITEMSPRVATIGDLTGDGQPDIAFVNSNSNTLSVLTNKMREVPIIQSYTPAVGSRDTVITITGRNFLNTETVYIGGERASNITITATTIKATVGTGATGDIVVNTPLGTAVSPGFTYKLPAPVVQSFTPEWGAAGTKVTVKGKNFRAVSSGVTVYFGAVKAAIDSTTDSTLFVTVPTGASYMPLTVTANGLTAYSEKPFHLTFLGTGNGFKQSSFAAKKDFATGGNPRRVAAADFDGDGKTDLFVTNQSDGTVSFFRNTSTAHNLSLQAKQNLAAEADVFGVATGDFDGDGKTDIAVSNANNGNLGSISIRRNTSSVGAISFAEKSTLTIGNGPLGIAIGDLNADGKPDLVVTAGNSGFISVLKNTSDTIGQIAFDSPITVSALQHSDYITLADLDGDGKPEMITADFSGSSVSVWRNISQGGVIRFAAVQSYEAGRFPVAVSTGDFDNDGRLDIAVANYGSNTVSVLQNQSTPGTLAFAPKRDYNTGELPRHLALSDIDGDHKIDIIVSYNTPSAVALIRNTSTTGTLSFAPSIAYTTGVEPASVTVADLDGDSKPELVVPNNYSSIAIFHNRIDQPVITRFTPTAAETDSIVTIIGENLKEATAVTFGGTPALSFTATNDTTIIAKVGTGSSGKVQVSTPYGIDSLSEFTYIPPSPRITSFSPASGTVGTVVKIAGVHFTGVQTVHFSNLAASFFVIQSDSVILATVGKGASGNIVVTSKEGNDTLGHFTFITPQPVITSFAPATGSTGTPVTIKGKNFTWTTGISFGNTNVGSFVINNDSTLTTVLGEGATGTVRVTTEFGNDTLGHFIYLEPQTILAYPNPSTGAIKLAHPAKETSSQIKIMDMNGRVIKTITVPQNQTQTKIDVMNLQPGIYKVTWSDGSTSISQTVLIN